MAPIHALKPDPPPSQSDIHKQSRHSTKMAGSGSSFANNAVSVSQEEFKMFHTIDRTLFTRLVFNLGRDPAEATQVMALWLWLEMVGEEIDMVYSKLLSLPDPLLNALVEESVMALACIESDKFPFASDSAENIPLIQNLTKTVTSLRFFYDNRLGIVRGVTKIINEVCIRAFEDILKLAQGSDANTSNIGGDLGQVGDGLQNFNLVNTYMPMMDPSSPFWYHNSGVQVHPSHMGALQYSPADIVVGRPPEISMGFDPYDLSLQRNILNNEISEVLNRMKLSVDEEVKEKEQEVPPDDRTIFLTFSKGYPISEDEIREFFTRRVLSFAFSFGRVKDL